MDLTGNALFTHYWIVLDSSGDYHAFSDYNDTLNDSYIQVGDIKTVTAGVTGGTSGGGGLGGGGTGGPRFPGSM